MTDADPTESDTLVSPDEEFDPHAVSGGRACLSILGMSLAVIVFASAVVAVVVAAYNLTH